MNRLQQIFLHAKKQNRAALLTFITAGDPNFTSSLEVMHALANNGADIIELGMPFSDPVADGGVIQLANLRAIANGQNLSKTLELVRIFRQTNQQTPIVLMGYFNPIHYYGVNQFIPDAKKAGIDGLLIVDLPPEHQADLYDLAIAENLAGIRLVTPSTNQERLPFIIKNSSGFIYYVAVNGITGGKLGVISDIAQNVANIKQMTDLPVVVGFGIKNSAQVKEVANLADGVVVGSALVDAIYQAHERSQDVPAIIGKMCAELASNL